MVRGDDDLVVISIVVLVDGDDAHGVRGRFAQRKKPDVSEVLFRLDGL